METVAGGNTRRYHATVQYPSAVQPHDFNLLEEFWLDPFPIWRYQLASAAIEKTVCLPDTQQAVLVRYLTTHACRFTVRLFLSFRDYHSLTQRNSAVKNDIKEGQTRIILAPYEDLPALTVFHGAGAFTRDGIWFLNHEYLRELDRGLDFREDLFSPEFIAFELSPEQPAWFIATLEPDRFPALLAHQDIELILAEEASRKYFNAPTPLESTLNRVLDQFRVVRSKGLPSLIAGFLGSPTGAAIHSSAFRRYQSPAFRQMKSKDSHDALARALARPGAESLLRPQFHARIQHRRCNSVALYCCA
jgi:predicted glycogen debranching enzyme